jgi:hypothetical protein
MTTTTHRISSSTVRIGIRVGVRIANAAAASADAVGMFAVVKVTVALLLLVLVVLLLIVTLLFLDVTTAIPIITPVRIPIIPNTMSVDGVMGCIVRRRQHHGAVTGMAGSMSVVDLSVAVAAGAIPVAGVGTAEIFDWCYYS